LQSVGRAFVRQIVVAVLQIVALDQGIVAVHLALVELGAVQPTEAVQFEIAELDPCQPLGLLAP